MGRIIVITLALIGALGGSQAPEFSQQYTQRVGGAADELQSVVDRFESDAARSGLTRDEAVSEMEGANGFAGGQGRRMRETIDRYERLSDLYARLQAAGPFERTWIVMRDPDPRILERTLADYRPAVPTTVDGAAHAASGAGVLGVVGGFFASLFRRRRPA